MLRSLRRAVIPLPRVLRRLSSEVDWLTIALNQLQHSAGLLQPAELSL